MQNPVDQGKQPNTEPGLHFSNHERMKVAAYVIAGLTAVEAIIVHCVLIAIFGLALWTWLLLAPGLYNSIWILGRYYACMAVLPHIVGKELERLRCGTIAEVPVPRSGITSARTPRHGRASPGKLDIDGAKPDGSRAASFTNGGPRSRSCSIWLPR